MDPAQPFETEVLPLALTAPDPRDVAHAISRAADLIRRGQVVAFPTETVYGLGADALNPDAVDAIYRAKGRPAHNPIIVHVADIDAARRLVTDWPPAAQTLAERIWPGPLTLVLPKSRLVPPIVTAGGPTVAIRAPAHPVALALIRAAGAPLAAPSANRSGGVSPTRAEHVLRSLGGRIPLILDAGPTSGGLESTVLDLTTSPPRILRPGPVTASELAVLIGPVHWAEPGLGGKPSVPAGGSPPGAAGSAFPSASGDSLSGASCDSLPSATGDSLPGASGGSLSGATGDLLPGATGSLLPVHGHGQEDTGGPAAGGTRLAENRGQSAGGTESEDAPLRSPGQLERHYAPRAVVVLVADSASARARLDAILAQGRSAGWMRFQLSPAVPASREASPHAGRLRIVDMPCDAASYAAALYAALHELDDAGVDHIVVELPPSDERWAAARDRLRRAAPRG